MGHGRPPKRRLHITPITPIPPIAPIPALADSSDGQSGSDSAPSVQPDLFPIRQDDAGHEVAFRVHLYQHGWQTRSQLAEALSLSERKIRDLAESLGAEVVRGQAGFKLTAQVNPRTADLPLAIAAADASISQGKHMIRYGLALKKKLRAFIV